MFERLKKLNIKYPEEEITGDNIRAVARDFQDVEDASFLSFQLHQGNNDSGYQISFRRKTQVLKRTISCKMYVDRGRTTQYTWERQSVKKEPTAFISF